MDDFKKIQISDPNYPECFKILKADAPQTLYAYGDLDLIQYQRNISVVGTRAPSLYGKHSTRALVQSLKDFDACIVSGLARGIDSEAHLSALESGLPSIAVIASGLEAFDYSGTQRKLFNEMRKRDDCLIISEFPPEFSAIKRNFPHRNRLIAALSPVTVVIEAGLKSGTLVTAEHVIKQNKELLVLPGDLGKESFRGSNKLLAENKAQAIFSISLLSKYLSLKPKPISNPNQENSNKQKELNKISKQILDLIHIEPISFDDLVERLGINQISLSTQLSLLEVQGLLRRESGMKFSKTCL
jgi:DNA processing protein